MNNSTLILEFAHALSSAKDAVAADRVCCDGMARIFDAELASILDVDEEGGVFRFRYSLDLSPEQTAELTLRLDEGICGAAAESGQAISVYDAAKTPQHSSKIKDATRKPIGSLLALPLFVEGRCACVIEVMNRRSGPFTPEDKELGIVLAALYMQKRMRMKKPAKHDPKRNSPKAGDVDRCKIVGSSLAMDRVLRLISKAAPTELPVLILGETGTGKELVAQRVHAGSRRADKPLVAINCAALSETLLESELFGHVKGAFTGAAKDRRGRLEEAHGGTVFLDEVGDMSPTCQAKLLRALDYGEIAPVGTNDVRKIDIRLIAATNQPLSRMVEKGTFRADLFYRLRGFQIDLPPLRDRSSDIPLLVEHFIAHVNKTEGSAIEGCTEDALSAMRRYDWPGNVRELFHAVKMAAAVAEGGMIGVEDLPRDVTDAPSNPRGAARRELSLPDKAPPTADEERDRIIRALQATAYPGTGRWNLASAARELGMNRKSLEYKVRKVYRLL